jgi:CHAT domain-containing protein
MDGASLVHIASHGQFRVDSPLFSNLRLDDGPLTVHDLERLHRAPYRLVLSACDSGVGAPVGGDETLGLVSALLSLGSSSVLCSVTKVNDDATVQVMLDVHSAVQKGLSLPSALVEAGLAARGDPLREATAAAFVSLGA